MTENVPGEGIWRRFRRGKGSGAEDSLPQDKASAQEEAASHAALGDEARDRRAWAEATEHYQRALQLRPDWTGIRVQLGNMLKEAGELADAEAAYRHASGEDPDDPDIRLQLGHVLKLQMRAEEARAAYLEAARLGPLLRDPIVELRAMGMSQRAIQGHISAHGPATARRGQAINEAGATLVSIDRTKGQGVRGHITDVGRTYVAGEIRGLHADALPLILVCRAGARPLTTLVVEAGNDEGTGDARPLAIRMDVSSLPRTVSFKMNLPDAAGQILRLGFDADDSEFVGSPFLLPTDAAASLLDRIDALEAQVSGPTPDLLTQLESRLASHAVSAACDAVERLLVRQRETFERELVALEQRMNVGAKPIQKGSLPKPREVLVSAQDGFDGVGWSRLEMGVDGTPVRFIHSRAGVRLNIDMEAGAYLELRIPSTVQPEALRGISVWAGGVPVPFWIESGPAESVTDGYCLGALIPANAADTCSCHFVLGDPRTEIGVASLRAKSLPAGQPSPRGIPVQGWRASPEGFDMTGAAARIVWPAVPEAAGGGARLVLLEPTDSLQCFINGDPAEIETLSGKVLVRSPALAWRTDRPNVLTLRRLPPVEGRGPTLIEAQFCPSLP